MILSTLTTPEVDQLIAADAPVAIGVSGGKDSSAVVFATIEHLDRVGHRGPRLLIHSDLGFVEWRDSLPWCHKLADRLALELVVVRREKGDMMDRWEQRWRDNVDRYINLKCVKLILPWSTPDMRFCTSELKTAIICRELSGRFTGRTIVSVSGIRRDESRKRAKAEIVKPQAKLASKTRATDGVDWNPILHWSRDQVIGYLERVDFPLHPAYTQWGMSRVSCAFCIMANASDVASSVRCPDNHDLYRRMVALELEAAFAFQSGGWLADVAPELLDRRSRIPAAKMIAQHRQEIEGRIPKHLLYTKGWPTCVPTQAEAELLVGIRKQIGKLQSLSVRYATPAKLIARYKELYEAKHGVAA